ncbi:polysaccharide deacetylase family protein [Candidatus Peregrinibacteria bacterium]|nr:polysaccharide deacetylase family protein [Candidatus Peregrinibacteria bacterium]
MKKKYILILLAALMILTGCRFGQTAVLMSNVAADSRPLKITPPGQESILVPVLVYHHIGTPPKNLSSAGKSLFIQPEWLEKHLQYLKEHGFSTVRFSNVADYFEFGTPLPERPVIINFDDGYKSTYEKALPILQKYGMTATVFIPANLMEHRAYMSWDQVKGLRDADWEIGSHSLWHPYLTKSRKAQFEIAESKKILEEKMGEPITVFAYPFGNYNTRIEQMAKDAGYRLARSFTSGNGISQKNLFHIPVVRVWGNLDLSVWKKQLFAEE